PVYTNVTASPVTDADSIREVMLLQLTSSVRWIETIEKMVKDGVSKAFELGPGNVLAGLVKRIDSTLNVLSVSDASEIMEIVNEKA
ncbi:MAG: ACP S-malonyltransferase, partial [Candidatus Latescibacteria bacterium]|nr:ACP S-malonyltransferase [Candidatus Latescibacterota bacterium]